MFMDYDQKDNFLRNIIIYAIFQYFMEISKILRKFRETIIYHVL